MKSTQKMFFSVLSLMFLAGCAWWPFSKSKSEGSKSTKSDQVLLMIDGEPVITQEKYEKILKLACENNPQLRMIIDMMPNAEKDLIFKGIVTAELIKAWAKKQGIDQTEEFKEQRKQIIDSIEAQLYMKAFDDAHPVQISDSDIAKFYEEKKDMIPALTLTPGGVDVTFVKFENKAKADAFYEKVKEVKKATTFKAKAEESALHVSDSVINEQSQVDPVVKQGILDIKKYPTVQIIKSDDGYWVLLATAKTGKVYRDLNSPEIHDGLQRMLMEERKNVQLEALINQLKDELKISENTAYFDTKQAARQDSSAQMEDDAEQEQMQQRSVKM